MEKRRDPSPDIERRDYTEYPPDDKPEHKTHPFSAFLAFLRRFGLFLLGVLLGNFLRGLFRFLLGLG